MLLCLQKIWSGLIRCLLRPRVSKVCCVSRLEGRAITLTQEYIRGADQIHLEFSIEWPLLLPALIPPIAAIRLIRLHDQPLREPGRCVMTRGARTTRVSLDFSADTLAGENGFHVQIVRRPGDELVETVAFHSLDIAQVASELRAECLDLFALQHGKRIRCDRMHNEVEEVGFNVELTLDNHEHRSFLNQMGAELRAELAPDCPVVGSIGWWTKPLQFGGSSFR